MHTEPYWIEHAGSGKLAIMTRPRGGDWLEDEMDSLHSKGVNVIVSLLESSEMEELDLTEEALCCRDKGMRYLSFSIPDRSVPDSMRETVVFVRKLAALLSDKQKIVIHCRQGVGRSALIAASVMILISGISADAAFGRIAQARGCQVPDTEEQRSWVRSFADVCS